MNDRDFAELSRLVRERDEAIALVERTNAAVQDFVRLKAPEVAAMNDATEPPTTDMSPDLSGDPLAVYGQCDMSELEGAAYKDGPAIEKLRSLAGLRDASIAGQDKPNGTDTPEQQ